MQDTVADYLIEASPTILYATSGSDADATFTAPWDGWIVAKAAADSNLVLWGVGAEQVNLAKSALLTGYPVPAGDVVIVRVTNGVAGGKVGDPASDDCQFLPRAASIALSGASFDNNGAGAVTISEAQFDNGASTPISIAGASFDNTGAGAVTIAGAQFDNTGAQAKVLEGEQSPVSGVQSPTSPTTVAHTDTLVAGTNYLVQVGSRAAPVTILLPDPGALGQRIEISDISAQAATYAVTVDGGTKDIETSGVKTFLIDRNSAVLAIYYTGTKWKML